MVSPATAGHRANRRARAYAFSAFSSSSSSFCAGWIILFERKPFAPAASASLRIASCYMVLRKTTATLGFCFKSSFVSVMPV